MSISGSPVLPDVPAPPATRVHPPGTKRLVINADDFGASPEVNAEIIDLMTQRKITSATIIANAPAVEQALRRLHDFPYCSFGAHLNISQYAPLTRHPALAPLLDSEGNLTNSIRDVPITSALRQAIFLEWSQQLQFLLERQVPISHIDTHHHVHTIPQLFLVLKRIQKKFGIRVVRISANLYPSNHPVSFTLLCKKLVWNFALRRFHKTVTTAGFCSFEFFHTIALKRPIPQESIELMVHPGSPHYRHETHLLHQTWQKSLPFPCRLISFNEL